MLPFSCSWDNQIDIDRLGNIFPILESLNRERSNKHIREYKKLDEKTNFLKYLDKLIPTDKIYDTIVNHNDTKPHIFNSDEFNRFCEKNETRLVDCFLEKIFPGDDK